MSADDPTESSIRTWCTEYLARTLKVSSANIDPDAKFARLGVDSATSVFFLVDLEEWLGLDLHSDLFFEHETISELARYLTTRCASPER